MKVKMNRPEWTFGTEFLFYTTDRDGYILHVAEPITIVFKEIPRGARIENPSLSFHDGQEEDEFIQSFLDEAWKLGYRPSETQKTEKELNSILEATKYHLEDMRKLVFAGPIDFERISEPNLTIQSDRIREAAASCPETKRILEILFPEVFIKI